MRRLVLLRHGETDWNAERRYQGQTDVPLNEAGVLQAKRVAPALTGLPPALIWSSDLSRAAETARIVGSAAGITPSYDPRLREIDVGSLAGRTLHEIIELAGSRPHAYDHFEGESEHAVAGRMKAVLDAVVAALDADATGVVVSHGHALRLALAARLGWPLDAARALGPLGNCGWIELTERASDAWVLAAYNRTADPE